MKTQNMKLSTIAVLSLALLCFVNHQLWAVTNNQWQSIGPDRVAIKKFVHDSTNNLLYVVTGSDYFFERTIPRKIFRSTDCGQSWTEISRIETSNISQFEINPHNPDKLYINGHTSEIFHNSNDGGETWNVFDPNRLLDGIAIDIHNEQTIHAAGESAELTGEFMLTYMKSSNDGETWTDIAALDHIQGHVYPLITVDPQNPDRMYITASGPFNRRGTSPANELRIYRTNDNGLTWEIIARKSESFRSKITIDPDSTNILYCVTRDTIFQSRDFGDSWSVCLAPQSNRDFSDIIFHPETPGTILVGASKAVYTSSDNGISWTTYTNGLDDDCVGICFDRDNPATLYVAGISHFYSSENNGIDWGQQAYDSIRTSHIFDMALAQTEADTMYIIQAPTNTLKAAMPDISSTDEVPWQYLPWDISFHNSYSFGVDQANAKTVYFIPYYNGGISRIKRSDDGGNTWTFIDNTLTYPRCITTDAAGILYIGGFDHTTEGRMVVHKSTDQGQTWSAYTLAITTGEIHSIAIDPTNPDIIYAGGFYGSIYDITTPALFKTINGGDEWTNITSNLGSRVNVVCIDPFNTNNVFAGTETHVFTSDNAGESWNASNDTFDDVKAIIPDSHFQDRIYIGTSNGVFVSHNGGATWRPMNDGLPELDILCMEYSADKQVLYVGTNGEGIFQMKIDETTDCPDAIQEIPFLFQLHQNYPNPFNPKTVLSYQLSVESEVKLSIYNLTGQKVATLVSGRQSVGEHRVQWNAEGLPSGIYVARLKAGTFVKTQKLILNK